MLTSANLSSADQSAIGKLSFSNGSTASSNASGNGTGRYSPSNFYRAAAVAAATSDPNNRRYMPSTPVSVEFSSSFGRTCASHRFLTCRSNRSDSSERFFTCTRSLFSSGRNPIVSVMDSNSSPMYVHRIHSGCHEWRLRLSLLEFILSHDRR